MKALFCLIGLLSLCSQVHSLEHQKHQGKVSSKKDGYKGFFKDLLGWNSSEEGAEALGSSTKKDFKENDNSSAGDIDLAITGTRWDGIDLDMWDGQARTTEYWDCCKPQCAWPNRKQKKGTVRVCDKDGATTVPADSTNACGGGGGIDTEGYMCTDQSPFMHDGVLHGFVATKIGHCCECYQLLFESGREMIVQRTNTASTPKSDSHFAIALPGAGTGHFALGCPKQFGWSFDWQQWNGVKSSSQCDRMPDELHDGCMLGHDELGHEEYVQYKRIKCPAVLVERTGCR